MDFKDTDLVLELGAGENPIKRHPNWHTHDGRWLPTVDHWFSLDSFPYPVASEFYDGVVARYCLEHVSWRNLLRCLQEIFRILKPGGMLFATMPNLEEQCRVLANLSRDGWPVSVPGTWETFQELVCGIFGDQDYPANSHKCGLSPDWTVRRLEACGFQQVKVEPVMTKYGPTDMQFTAFKSRAVILPQ